MITDKISEKVISYLFRDANISIGTNVSDDINVHDPRFFTDVLFRGSIGFGDSYMDKKWDSDRIDELVYKIFASGVYQRVSKVHNLSRRVSSRLINFQSKERSRQVIGEHYDLPVEFYASFLDPSLQYTCALFDNTNDLDEAQIKKMGLICKKTELKEGDRVLDIGGGWGGLARFMKEQYGVRPTVVTLSQEQANHILRSYPGIDVKICDYRDIPSLNLEKFDVVTIVGFSEHVGHKNFEGLTEIVKNSLKPKGKYLLHTLLTSNDSPGSNPWLNKHIFPNGELLPRKLIEKHNETSFEFVEREYPGFHEITPHYTPTLIHWDKNLQKSVEQDRVSISEREHRKWHFYFTSCAGSIRAKHMRVAQFNYMKR